MNTSQSPDQAEQYRAAIVVIDAAFTQLAQDMYKAAVQMAEAIHIHVSPAIEELNRVYRENQPIIDEMIEKYESQKRISKSKTPR